MVAIYRKNIYNPFIEKNPAVLREKHHRSEMKKYSAALCGGAEGAFYHG
ncbi:MAG: hypothetical protein IKC24_01810 [Oscillospiraceae bacterium]|nr:hypothetical protein [Oscillospiraceae bacterium]MBR6678430.1 hypothetical protein [Oscillospiraceae bacterium]